MPYQIWPQSPVWADIQRTPIWNETVNRFDSGGRQALSPYLKALYRYQVSGRIFNETVQQSLEAFFNNLKGKVTPFLFKDPYDFRVAGVTQPSPGSGFYARDARSWHSIPDSAAIVIHDAGSGALVLGTHYTFSMDNGFVTNLVSATGRTWVASFESFKLVAFENDFVIRSPIWNIFSINLTFQEIATYA